ncbi:MAG: FAD-binding protein [Holdemania massiliensis]
MEKQAKELGVDIRTGTKGEELILDGKDVTGVKVTNNDNESYDIQAQAVIIATGGFCSNKELLEYAQVMKL